MFIFAFSALVLDFLLGEARHFHPLVGFGHYANFLEKNLNIKPNSAFLGRALGVLALCLALLPVLILAGVCVLIAPYFWQWALLEIIVLYFCVGFKSLFEHVGAVRKALQAKDLNLAREKLSLIVSRDTQLLDGEQVAQATLETWLENSLDALFASLFWFALGGAVGALVHRLSNTLDAMWGYKNSRFYYFGWAAARLDDVLAFVPARLVAGAFVLVGEHKKQAWQCLRIQAKQCDSPNAGPVFCAGAGALNVRLSAGAYYAGQWCAKPLMGAGAMAQLNDLKRGQMLVIKALFWWLLAMLCWDVASLWLN